MGCYRIVKGDLDVRVRVTAGAERTEPVRVAGGELWYRVAAVPEKGRANKTLIRDFAGRLGIAASAIELTTGATSRHKRLKLPIEASKALAGVVSGLPSG